jgi:hypothetical protein
VLSVLATNVLDTDIINHKGETHRAGDRSEETGGVGGWDVLMDSKVGEECIVGKAACLWEAVHAMSDLGVDVTLVNEWAEVVVFEDVLGDVRDFNLHVLKVVHWSAEVEIFDVHCHEFGARGGDDTVEEKLGSGKAGRLGAPG